MGRRKQRGKGGGRGRGEDDEDEWMRRGCSVASTHLRRFSLFCTERLHPSESAVTSRSKSSKTSGRLSFSCGSTNTSACRGSKGEWREESKQGLPMNTTGSGNGDRSNQAYGLPCGNFECVASYAYISLPLLTHHGEVLNSSSQSIAAPQPP